MNQTTIQATKLTADTGHVFTQTTDVPTLSRIFTSELYLATTDSADAWREITDAEAAPLRAAQKEAQRIEEERRKAEEAQSRTQKAQESNSENTTMNTEAVTE